MGFMDKVKDSVKSADERLGNAIDKEKIDSDIRREERNIDDLTAQIGKKVVAAVKDGKDANSAEISYEMDRIKESEQKIADLKEQKEEIRKKEE